MESDERSQAHEPGRGAEPARPAGSEPGRRVGTDPGAGSGRGAPNDGTGRDGKLRLDQFLKLRGLVLTGGEAKVRIQSGEVSVNGEIETRRGRGLRPGDRIRIEGTEVVVDQELFSAKPREAGAG